MLFARSTKCYHEASAVEVNNAGVHNSFPGGPGVHRLRWRAAAGQFTTARRRRRREPGTIALACRTASRRLTACPLRGGFRSQGSTNNAT